MNKEDKAGLYFTIIIHLGVLIVLLATSLGISLKKETSFVLDFTKLEEMEKLQEQIEKLQKEAELQEAVSQRLQQELGNIPVRNVAVDRSSLKDDRGTDAEQLYKDAERLQKELNSGFSAPEEDYASLPDKKQETKKAEPVQQYSGPSVLSWSLEGRKASRLPIPAYRCMGAGEVTVLISVDPSGTVLAAKVDDSCSAKDGCLRAFAVRAARLSKFSASASAPSRQAGTITYQFIAQ